MNRTLSLVSGLGVVIAALAFAVWGGWSAVSAFSAPKTRETGVAMDAATARSLVIPATARGEAEAATLRRVVGVLQGEGVALRTGSFKAAADARLVSITFDFEGPRDAMWRAVHAMESGSPALVMTRIRATSRDSGDIVSISADALAAWAPPEPAAAKQSPAPLTTPPAAPPANPSTSPPGINAP